MSVTNRIDIDDIVRDRPAAAYALFGETRTRIAKAYAKEGDGWEDILVRMKLGTEWRGTVRAIVLGKQ